MLNMSCGVHYMYIESDLRCVLQRHKVSLANIRDWNTSNICLFYYFYAFYGIFISSGMCVCGVGGGGGG